MATKIDSRSGATSLIANNDCEREGRELHLPSVSPPFHHSSA